jgi:hypothetical protein
MKMNEFGREKSQVDVVVEKYWMRILVDLLLSLHFPEEIVSLC